MLEQREVFMEGFINLFLVTTAWWSWGTLRCEPVGPIGE
jgi:hypothetical protein